MHAIDRNLLPDASRPSTNRASTITRNTDRDTLRITRSRPSTINQPSKYDHTSLRDSTRNSGCLGRQPTEQVRSPPLGAGAEPCAGVSAVNQPSKYDHLASRSPRASSSRLSRQPTEQVRSPKGDGANKSIRRVSAVNQPNKYDHGSGAVGVGEVTWSRPSTNRASTITLVPVPTSASRPSTNRASTITSWYVS